MKTSTVVSVALARHPRTASAAVHGIEVAIERSEPGLLALGFRVDGALARIRVPPPSAPRRAHGLWQHTCFEAFVALDDGPSYHEFNFAPSGEWAAYAFQAYRVRVPLEDEALAPRIAVRTAGGLELDAVLRLDRLSARHPRAALRLGLSAVIEESDGRRSYWALRHPPGRPDFHRPEVRALALDAPPG